MLIIACDSCPTWLKQQRTNRTSAEMRLFPLFLKQTPVGDCTSSEDVPDAWSLSPSDPIFRFSWTISEWGEEKWKGVWVLESVRKKSRAQHQLKTSLEKTYIKALCVGVGFYMPTHTNKIPSPLFRPEERYALNVAMDCKCASHRGDCHCEAWPWVSPSLLHRWRSEAAVMVAS